MPMWWATVAEINNPVRRCMHQLGLYSGLRVLALRTIERDWVDLENNVVHLPRSKTGGSFDLPVSERMAEIIEEALRAGEAMFGENPYLFPAWSNTTPKRVVPTLSMKERSLPSETGYLLRHTYKTVTVQAGISETDSKLLMDHKLPGISRVYVHEKALFGHLLKCQETVSCRLESLCAK
jgi:integrase